MCLLLSRNGPCAITMEPQATIRPSIKGLLLVSLMGWVTSCGQGLVEEKRFRSNPATIPEPGIVRENFRQIGPSINGSSNAKTCLPIAFSREPCRNVHCFPFKIRRHCRCWICSLNNSSMSPLSQSEAWVRPLESKESFLNPSTAYFEKGGTPFMPFAMKLALPLTTASCFMEISTEIFIPSTPG